MTGRNKAKDLAMGTSSNLMDLLISVVSSMFKLSSVTINLVLAVPTAENTNEKLMLSSILFKNIWLFKLNYLWIFLLTIGMSVFLISCKPDEGADKQLQETYHIQMGQDSFFIPVDYLVDSRNRVDAEEVRKIKVPPNSREGKYTPHNYVILMGRIPDVNALENGRKYSISPNRTHKTVEFNMSYNPKGNYVGVENVVRREANDETIKLPDFSKLKEGLIAIGYKDKPKGMYEYIYIYIKSKKPIAYIRCERKPERVNPSCWANVSYSEAILMDVIFSAENLKWFSEEGGIDKILALVKSWQKVQ